MTFETVHGPCVSVALLPPTGARRTLRNEDNVSGLLGEAVDGSAPMSAADNAVRDLDAKPAAADLAACRRIGDIHAGQPSLSVSRSIWNRERRLDLLQAP